MTVLTGEKAVSVLLGRYGENILVPIDANKSTGQVLFQRPDINYLLFNKSLNLLQIATNLASNPMTKFSKPKVPFAHADITGLHLYDVENESLPGIGFTFTPEQKGIKTRESEVTWMIQPGSSLDVIIQTQVAPRMLYLDEGSTGAAFDLTTMVARDFTFVNKTEFPWIENLWLYTAENDDMTSPATVLQDMMTIPLVGALTFGSGVYGVLSVGERGRDFAKPIAEEFNLPYASSRRRDRHNLGKIDIVGTSATSNPHTVRRAFWNQGNCNGKHVFIYDNVNASRETANLFAEYVIGKGAIPVFVTAVDLSYVNRPKALGLEFAPYQITRPYGNLKPSPEFLDSIGRT